jgi:hypothetical protein
MAPEGIVDAIEASCVEPRFSAHKHGVQKYGGSVFVM